ncbi:MAG TPA: OmpA family protein [Polyangiaceae bacterium]
MPALLGLLMSVGCGSAMVSKTHTTSAELPPPDAKGEYHVVWPKLGAGDARFIRLGLGPDTLSYCRRVSPKFAFDKSETYLEDNDQLVAFASCMNHPEMKNRRIVLVGRADARGTDAYNMALGARRAEDIRNHLVNAGIDPSRISVASRGDRGAKGYLPQYSNGFDRRVDVIVTGGEHRP